MTKHVRVPEIKPGKCMGCMYRNEPSRSLVCSKKRCTNGRLAPGYIYIPRGKAAKEKFMLKRTLYALTGEDPGDEY